MESLEDLRVLLDTMTPDQRIAKIREIREDRRISKHAVTVRVKQSKDRKQKLKDRFKSMTTGEQEEFLKLMKEAEDEGR